MEARISVRKDQGYTVNARELALIAGLDSYRTVVNDARSNKSTLYEKAIDGRARIMVKR